jgi:hypothetical protein
MSRSRTAPMPRIDGPLSSRAPDMAELCLMNPIRQPGAGDNGYLGSSDEFEFPVGRRTRRCRW